MVQDVLSRPLSRDCRERTRHSYVAIYQLSHVYICNHITIYVYLYIYMYVYVYYIYVCSYLYIYMRTVYIEI